MRYHMLRDQSVKYWSVRTWTSCQAAYLVLYADAFDDFEEGLTQPLTIVSVVKSGEAKEPTLDFPQRRCRFIHPMAGDSKITVGVAGLPCVTCEIDNACDR
jgi:hypothetical protein